LARLAATALLLLALPASAFAADISVTDSGYDPATYPPIKVGTTVDWAWNTTLFTSPVGRSVTSDSGDPEPFDSGLQSAGATFTHTFNTPGHYGYHDSAGGPHAGSLTVYGGPSLSVTPSSSTINRGGSVTFTATADTNPSGGALSYEWDLDGDGTYETPGGTSQTVAFPTAGSYAVAVHVTDPAGNQATGTATVQVNLPDSDGDGVNDDADHCPNNPASTPDGCPLVAPLVPGPIATSAVAPGALATVGALKSGVNVVLSCSAACSGVFTLTYNGQPVVEPTTESLTGAGSELVTLRFTSTGKHLLARVQKPRLLMSVAVTDAFGRKQINRRWVQLESVKTYGKLPAIGISDNNQTTFDDPNFQILKLRFARLVSPWNAIFTEPARLDAWLQAARAHGIRPLVSFEHSRGMNCPGRKCTGPSTGQFKRAWAKFHKKYPWVKDLSPWNEVNSATQPTGRFPQMAAAYYNIVRANCRGCTIVAADLLDASNIRRYAYAFMQNANGTPRLWGLHNYTDTNRFRSRGTQALLQTVRGTVWLTETGGVVRFVTQSGKVALPRSETRAKKAMDYMFRLAEQNATRIKRIYVYQWKVNNVFDRFDAGVIRPDGTPRPSFQVLTLNASIARKR
jgi:plastocyanin